MAMRVAGVCLAIALVACVSFAHPEVVPLDNEATTLLGEAALSPDQLAQSAAEAQIAQATAEGGKASPDQGAKASPQDQGADQAAAGGKGGPQDPTEQAAEEAEEAAEGGIGGKGATQHAAEQAVEDGKGGKGATKQAAEEAAEGGKGGKGDTEQAAEEATEGGKGATEQTAEEAAEGGKGGKGATEQAAEEGGKSEEAVMTKTEEESKAGATINNAVDPSSVGKSIKSDISGATTVSEIHDVVEQRVAAAMSMKKEQNELANAEAVAKAKITKLAKDAESEKMKIAQKTGQLQSEKVKAQVEKAKLATIKEKAKRVKAERAVEAMSQSKDAQASMSKAKEEVMEKKEEEEKASLDKKMEEEKAAQAKAKRLAAEEVLKTDKAKSDTAKADQMGMPKTEHQIHLAQASAYKRAARLQEKAAEALNMAARSKAKSNAFGLMTSTAAAVKALQEKVTSGDEEVAADTSEAKQDLKKALAAPFSKNALEQVETGRSEVNQAKSNAVDLKSKLEVAQRNADTAKRAYFEGLRNGWGPVQRNPVTNEDATSSTKAESPVTEVANGPSEVAKPVVPVPITAAAETPDETAEKATSNSFSLAKVDDEPDKPVEVQTKEDAESQAQGVENYKKPDYNKMSEKEVAYWLAKPVTFPDSEPQSSQKVEGRVFNVKEMEAQQIQNLQSMAKSANMDLPPQEQASIQRGDARIEDGAIIDAKKFAKEMDAKSLVPELAPGEQPQDQPDDKEELKKLSPEQLSLQHQDVKRIEEQEIENAKQAANGEEPTAEADAGTTVDKPKGNQAEITQTEQAKTANPTPEAEDTQTDPVTQSSPTGSDAEVAQTEEAREAASSSRPSQLGESGSDFESEISADRALEDGQIGDSTEGVDEANADSELDDVDVEDDDNEVDDDEISDDDDDEYF
jgi:hypothetical protein